MASEQFKDPLPADALKAENIVQCRTCGTWTSKAIEDRCSANGCGGELWSGQPGTGPSSGHAGGPPTSDDAVMTDVPGTAAAADTGVVSEKGSVPVSVPAEKKDATDATVSGMDANTGAAKVDEKMNKGV